MNRFLLAIAEKENRRAKQEAYFSVAPTSPRPLRRRRVAHGQDASFGQREMLVTGGLPTLVPSPLQWIPFVLRKTLFDFIKSCGSQIRLKISEVAFLGLLYSPK